MAEMNESLNFIDRFIQEDIAEGGAYEGKTVHTRFPPEPNGYGEVSLVSVPSSAATANTSIAA